MPSLATLKKQSNRKDFVAKVVGGVQASAQSTVDVNRGIKTTADLKERLVQGRGVKFDTERLINESRSY